MWIKRIIKRIESAMKLWSIATRQGCRTADLLVTNAHVFTQVGQTRLLSLGRSQVRKQALQTEGKWVGRLNVLKHALQLIPAASHLLIMGNSICCHGDRGNLIPANLPVALCNCFLSGLWDRLL